MRGCKASRISGWLLYILRSGHDNATAAYANGSSTGISQVCTWIDRSEGCPLAIQIYLIKPRGFPQVANEAPEVRGANGTEL